MAFPPKTWVEEALFAADLNASLRDNLNLLKSPSRVRVRRTAVVSMGNGWSTKSWTVADFNTDSMWSLGTNPTRITFNTAGLYVVGGSCGAAANANNTRGMELKVNASRAIAAAGYYPATSLQATWLTCGCVHAFSVGDYLELNEYQDSGGSLNDVVTDDGTPCMWAYRLAA